MRYKGSTKTKCPYYEKESDKSITCQGFYSNTFTASKFRNRKEKEEFQKKNCYNYPNGCIICKHHDRKANEDIPQH